MSTINRPLRDTAHHRQQGRPLARSSRGNCAHQRANRLETKASQTKKCCTGALTTLLACRYRDIIRTPTTTIINNAQHQQRKRMRSSDPSDNKLNTLDRITQQLQQEIACTNILQNQTC
ncbi:hypothetical protein AOLI_G00068430 [Acnodon oligacanthus]